MAARLRNYRPSDLMPMTALLRHASLASDFDWLIENGELEDPLRQPFADRDAVWVAEDAGSVVAFSMLIQLISGTSDASMMRIGVHGSHRRVGIGRALLERSLEHLKRTRGPAHLLLVSHWLPSESGPPFARRHGFVHDRWFWSMERVGEPQAAPPLPEGVVVRAFDGSDRAFADWNDCYNRAFAENAFSPTSTIEECRRLTESRGFDPSGLFLAYRDDRCIGFARNALYPETGEVDVLGVGPEARGIGLGRALLRLSSGWLLSRGAPKVRLMVDGENETALRLYRSEGFEVVRTRQIWRRRVGAES